MVLSRDCSISASGALESCIRVADFYSFDLLGLTYLPLGALTHPIDRGSPYASQ